MDKIQSAVSASYIHAPNWSADIGGTRLAYRDVGPRDAVPIILLNHWGATLDNFDPRIVDGLAVRHRVITVDYRGIGLSSGTLPGKLERYTDDIIGFIRSLGLSQVDLFGFSLGGFIAQDIAIKEPSLVRKMILAGTGPAGGQGLTNILLSTWLILKSVFTFKDPKYYLFFPASSEGNGHARQFLKRLEERKSNRDKVGTLMSYARQLRAILDWKNRKPQDLGAIKSPTLIVNGDNDLMIPTRYSADMHSRIPGSKLVIYERAGHGSIFQYHSAFVDTALDFLAS